MKTVLVILVVVAVAARIDAKKRCFPIDDPICTKPFEVYDGVCGGPPCLFTCDALINGPACRAACSPGCRCKDGYARNDKEVCIPIKSCPNPKCTKPFEVYDGICGGPPCLFTCEALTGGPKCRASCRSGCRCKDGYALTSSVNGACIPIKSCPKPVCTKPNEVYSSSGDNPCEGTCQSPNKPFMCKAAARPGCGCKIGYLRNSKGFCVLPKDCDPPLVCASPNEAYKCLASKECEPTCDKRNIAEEDCAISTCRYDCYCKSGYIRNAQGVCVLPKDCSKPACTKKFEVYDGICGGPPCLFTCEALTGGPQCRAPCRPGCRCKDGYALNDKGVCIPIKSCPKTCKKPFEVYDGTCGGPPCLFTCRALMLGPTCRAACGPGCRCKDGYAFNDKEECIPLESCPNPCIKAFEEYKSCGTACPLTCEKPVGPLPCTKQCVKGCFCKNGYVRDNKGDCIRPNQCQTCGKNEEYTACNAFCGDKSCRSLIYPVACKPAGCTPGCICKENFYRNDNKVCVAAKACPKN